MEKTAGNVSEDDMNAAFESYLSLSVQVFNKSYFATGLRGFLAADGGDFR